MVNREVFFCAESKALEDRADIPGDQAAGTCRTFLRAPHQRHYNSSVLRTSGGAETDAVGKRRDYPIHVQAQGSAISGRAAKIHSRLCVTPITIQQRQSSILYLKPSFRFIGQ